MQESIIKNNQILVTGMPRSGTTWVGRIISQSPSVKYIHEPLNISGDACSCGVKFDLRYFCITDKIGAAYSSHFTHLLNSQFNIFNFLNTVRKFYKNRRVRSLAEYVNSLFTNRALMKSPSALFSTEWLVSNFDMDALIMVRHPAAVANSYKRLNWRHPFSHFLNQPELLAIYLHPFQEEIRHYANHTHDIVEQAAFLWKLIYHTVKHFQATRKDWIFLRHEDLAKDPIYHFRVLFDRLNLDFSNQIVKTIQASSHMSNPIESRNPYSIQRYSKEIAQHWKRSLSLSEIDKIRNIVEDVSSAYYSNNEW